MNNIWFVATPVFALWLLGFLLQLGDLGSAWLDGRIARAGGLSSRVARERVTGLFWVVPFLALVLVGEGMGIAYAFRLITDRDAPIQSILVMLALAVVATGSWLVVTLSITRPPIPGYRELAEEIVALEGSRASKDELESFRDTLNELDARPRPGLAPRLWRVAPVLIGVAACVLGWVAVANANRSLGWVESSTWLWVAGLAAVPLVSLAMMLLTVRVAATSAASWFVVETQRRAETMIALDELTRRSGKRVAGLGDRVSRALQILREQQNTGQGTTGN